MDTDGQQLPEQHWEDLALKAGLAFNPNTPIDERSLFAGRVNQVRRVVDVVNQRGQHAILFGERGVGKTSLANVLSQFLSGQPVPVIAPRVNCDGGDSFKSVWRKVFDKIEMQRQAAAIGFVGSTKTTMIAATDLLGDEKVTPDSVRRLLTIMSANAIPILIIDEFDRLKQEPRRAFADLIKSLSDHGVQATVLLVGVADSVGNLIAEHQSVSRALVQIRMPRMTSGEIRQIIETGTVFLGMQITEDASRRIVLLAKGLPHYAHLVARHSARAALDSKSLSISLETVNHSISQAIEDAQHSIRSAYHDAIRSARKETLFGDVLLACALAESEELGFFAAQDIRPPMKQITGKDYDIPRFAQHLTEFSDERRGCILQRTGHKRRYRYRFSDPLMQPYVIMQGIHQRKIGEEALASRET